MADPYRLTSATGWQMARLAVFGMRRIADMDRGQLIDTINALYTSLLAVNGRGVREDRTELPPSEVDQYTAVLERWFMGDVHAASAVDPAQVSEGER